MIARKKWTLKYIFLKIPRDYSSKQKERDFVPTL